MNAYDAYGLHEAYELVEGEWVFQIWYQGDMLVEQKFTTYRPGAGGTSASAGNRPDEDGG